MKPDRKHLGVRVQQWAIDIVRSVAREYQLTNGEALEKIVTVAKPILLDGLARLALAAESAPKPDAVVWPKPRPISEAPQDGTMVLIRLPDSNPQWTIGVFARTHWVDLCLATAIVEPTHFLPLPPEPEVKE